MLSNRWHMAVPSSDLHSPLTTVRNLQHSWSLFRRPHGYLYSSSRVLHPRPILQFALSNRHFHHPQINEMVAFSNPHGDLQVNPTKQLQRPITFNTHGASHRPFESSPNLLDSAICHTTITTHAPRRPFLELGNPFRGFLGNDCPSHFCGLRPFPHRTRSPLFTKVSLV